MNSDHCQYTPGGSGESTIKEMIGNLIPMSMPLSRLNIYIYIYI